MPPLDPTPSDRLDAIGLVRALLNTDSSQADEMAFRMAVLLRGDNRTLVVMALACADIAADLLRLSGCDGHGYLDLLTQAVADNAVKKP